MLQTDLLGALVKYPSKLDDRYEPLEYDFGVIRLVVARRVKDSTFVSIVVQRVAHMIGKLPRPDALRAMSNQLGGQLVQCDLKHCLLVSDDYMREIFEPKTGTAPPTSGRR